MSAIRVFLVILIVIAALAFAAASTLLLAGVYQSEPIRTAVDGIYEMGYSGMIENGALGTVAAGGVTIVLLGLLAAKIV
jgi:hypothetical protein